MEYRELGRTGIRVSSIGLGCWVFAGDATWGPQEDSASFATVAAALDAGINLFDTAEGYGNGRSEEVLGKALAGRRQEAVLASKVSSDHLAAHDLIEACERSLRRLRTDYIDLYQVHWPHRTIPLAETLGALDRLRRAGKIRAFGVCNFGVQDLEELLALASCASDQLPYSLLFRAIELEIQPRCVEAGAGILCYSPLSQGLLTGKFRTADEVPPGRARTRYFSGARPGSRHGEAGQEAETFAAIEQIRAISADAGVPMAEASLAWLTEQPAVTSVLAGARTPEQARGNARAADSHLSAGVIRRLTEATDELKRKLGPNADEYQAGSESRIR